MKSLCQISLDNMVAVTSTESPNTMGNWLFWYYFTILLFTGSKFVLYLLSSSHLWMLLSLVQ